VEEEIVEAPRYFKVVHVFDIDQTEGQPLPEFAIPTLTGEASEELFGGLLALMQTRHIPVSFEPQPHQDPGIKGYYSPVTGIWIRPEEPRAQQLKTLIHECAHYYTENVFRIPRAEAETIAESAAYVIGAHYGFDTGVRSFPYVALWSRDKKVLEQNLGAIRRVAATLLEELEKIPSISRETFSPATSARHISETLTVESRGSTIVGAMAWETPMVIFVAGDGRRYRWVSNAIEDWESGLWPQGDKRRGQRYKLTQGSRIQVTALVRPDGKTLYRVNLSEPLETQPELVPQTQPEKTPQEKVRQVIESLQQAIDETRKADSIRHIERILDTTEVEHHLIGIDDLREVITDYKAITREGLTPEEYIEEKETAFESIVEAVEGLDVEEVGYGDELKRIAGQYGQWATRLAKAVCPHNDIACIEKEARRLQSAVTQRKRGFSW